MGKGKRNRNRKQARRKPFKNPKPVILILSEGEVTEPEYLRGFAETYRNSIVDIEVVGAQGASVPIVKRAQELKKQKEKQAKREKDNNIKYDAVWCLFDVDEHPDISSAVQMAKECNIELAISNPCFELWLWLHFQEQPGMQHRDKLQRMMKNHIEGYGKDNKHVDYSDYSVGYDDAVKRARRLKKDAGVEGWERNPTTGVYRLTEAIKKEPNED